MRVSLGGKYGLLQLCTNRKALAVFNQTNSSCGVKATIDAAVQSPSAGNCQPWHFL